MREPNLSTKQCFEALEDGYILENEHNYRVYLRKGKQFITNKRRYYHRRPNHAYKFDYPTWQIVGRLPLKERVVNKIYTLTRKIFHFLVKDSK